MPGMAFHITARTQSRVDFFKGREGTIERMILDGVRTSDATLLSHTVMPNHFHIMLRQGARPLGWIMHPIMRRIALYVQRACGAEDHVFGARFFSAAIETATYARTAIVYTNINPVRAKICRDAAEYLHSSHTRLALPGPDDTYYGDLRSILELFADEPNMNIEDLRDAYLRHAQWRLQKDVHDELKIPYDVPCPAARHGDRHFSTRFVALPVRPRKPAKDLRDRAIEILSDIDDTISIDALRQRTLPRFLARVRHQLIAGLLQAHYRGKAIAAFLRISESAVSKVATQLRYAAIS